MSEVEESTGDRRARLRRRRRWRIGLLAVGVIVVAGAGTAAAIGFGGKDPSTPGRSSAPPATATVTRQTLTETEDVNGVLGYGDATTIVARTPLGPPSGQTANVYTWLPAEGAVIGRGQPVYRVDNQPVPLIYGSVPLYRILRDGASGPDVKELEANLKALGYTGFTADSDYTAGTAEAVRDWQEDLGLDRTGVVNVNQVVVTRNAIRVAAVPAYLGEPAAGPLLSYTGSTRLVQIALDVSLQNLVRVGIAASVTLPDSSTVNGKVASVGAVASSSPGSNGGSKTTIAVEVSIAGQDRLGSLDAAPVQVTLVSDTRENVLTVPVAALVALAEGGYGVQVVQGGQTRYVAVETGMFADGRVEVSGGGLAEGTVIGVPS